MTEPRAFDSGDPMQGRAHLPSPGEIRSDNLSRRDRVRRSALWSAHGDALGWISELVDEKGLKRRTRGEPLQQPIAWKRRIGGRAGVIVDLPVGCYSDDSQLRLATGRSIRPDGFDVEAFSKVELTVWPSYALGGGRSTSAAAANLSKPKVQWFANMFKGWTNSGGNGAAMRIQPHVWASRSPGDPRSFIYDVVRNAICTHSHPNGLLGAVLHSLTLATALNENRHPSPDDLLAATEIAGDIPDLILGDVEVSQYWRPTFERDAGRFAEGWDKAVQECRAAVYAMTENSRPKGSEGYEAIVEHLRLRDETRRGSGVLTALAAVGLIWCEPQAERALNIAANAIGTDTDTIASMAGAILGINSESDPPVEVLDADLFRFEANRLSDIAAGGKPQSHQYPDLLHWKAPQTQADALVSVEGGGVWVDGLGRGEPLSEPIASPDPRFMWQWLKLDIGQTLLIKRRKVLPTRSRPTTGRSKTKLASQLPMSDRMLSQEGLNQGPTDGLPWSTSVPSPDAPKSVTQRMVSQSELEAMIAYFKAHKGDDRVVGQVIRRVVSKCSTGQIAAFLAEAIDCLREP